MYKSIHSRQGIYRDIYVHILFIYYMKITHNKGLFNNTVAFINVSVVNSTAAQHNALHLTLKLRSLRCSDAMQ